MMATELKQAHTAIAQLQREIKDVAHGSSGSGSVVFNPLDAQQQLPTLQQQQQQQQQAQQCITALENDKASIQADVLSFLRHVPMVRVLLACPTILLLPCVLMLLLLLLLAAFHVNVGTMVSNFLLLTMHNNGARSLRGTSQSDTDDALHFPTNTGGKGSL